MQATLGKMLFLIFARKVTSSKAHKYMTYRCKTRNLGRSGQPERGQRSDQGAQKVYRVVINQTTPLEPSPQKTIGDHAQDA